MQVMAIYDLAAQEAIKLCFLQIAKMKCLGNMGKFYCLNETFMYYTLDLLNTKEAIKATSVKECFEIHTCDCSIMCLDVNSSRGDRFVKEDRVMDSFTATFQALLQHAFRVAYEGEFFLTPTASIST